MNMTKIKVLAERQIARRKARAERRAERLSKQKALSVAKDSLATAQREFKAAERHYRVVEHRSATAEELDARENAWTAVSDLQRDVGERAREVATLEQWFAAHPAPVQTAPKNPLKSRGHRRRPNYVALVGVGA